jgi:hypothetical protein
MIPLLLQLGVKQPSPEELIAKLLQLYATDAATTITQEQHLRHLTFLATSLIGRKTDGPVLSDMRVMCGCAPAQAPQLFPAQRARLPLSASSDRSAEIQAQLQSDLEAWEGLAFVTRKVRVAIQALAVA